MAAKTNYVFNWLKCLRSSLLQHVGCTCYLVGMFLMWPSKKVCLFYWPEMQNGQSLNIGPNGETNIFSLSETRILIEPKLYMSSHWMVHYKIFILLFLQDCFTCCYEHQKKFWMAFVQYTKRPRKGLLLKENLAVILSNALLYM